MRYRIDLKFIEDSLHVVVILNTPCTITLCLSAPDKKTLDFGTKSLTNAIA